MCKVLLQVLKSLGLAANVGAGFNPNTQESVKWDSVKSKSALVYIASSRPDQLELQEYPVSKMKKKVFGLLRMCDGFQTVKQIVRRGTSEAPSQSEGALLDKPYWLLYMQALRH